MCGLAFSQHCTGIGAFQFVVESNHRFAYRLQPGAHNDFLIVINRRTVAALDLDHRDEQSVFALHVAVRKSHLSHQFHTAHFEPDQVVRVIHYTHLIGFRVTHTQPRFVRGRVMVGTHFPVHTGLRFSRNDAIPSRKSAVRRIAAFSRTAASMCASSSIRAWSVSNCFVARREDALFSISTAANSRARAIRVSADTISLISPIRAASSEPKILPVSSRSRACFSPTCRSRNVDTMAGTKPIRTSV